MHTTSGGMHQRHSPSFYCHFHEIYLSKVNFIESQQKVAAAPAQTQREGHGILTCVGHEVSLVEVQL